MPGLTRTRKYGGGDQRWMVNGHALRDGLTGSLALSSFTEADHYPDGYFPSGTPVNTANEGDLKPWTGAAGEKLGFLVKNEHPPGDDAEINVAYVWHGPINVEFVPGTFTVPTEGASNFTFVGDEGDEEAGGEV